MNINLGVTQKGPEQKIFSSSYASDQVSKISEIYKEEHNISIWERKLDSKIVESAEKALIKNPELQFSEIVKPENVKKTLLEKVDSDEETLFLNNDIEYIVNVFCNLFDLKQIWLRLDAINEPMCPRFHTDSVKCRLVTTYVGPGTQWLPHNVVNRSKLGHGNQGKADDKSGLFVNKKDIKELDTGHVALLKGEDWEGNKGSGLVHRSPHKKQNYKRLYMTIDFLDFYLSIYKMRPSF